MLFSILDQTRVDYKLNLKESFPIVPLNTDVGLVHDCTQQHGGMLNATTQPKSLCVATKSEANFMDDIVC